MEQFSTEYREMKARHLKTGAAGEIAVRRHLERKGYICLETNFKAKTGEIDIILERDCTVHFVEVKTVSYETKRGMVSRETAIGDVSKVPHGTTIDARMSSVPHETGKGMEGKGMYRPEDNVHHEKLRKILNTIQVWIAMNGYKGEWQLDLAAVYLDRGSKAGKIRLIENIIVE